MSLIKCEMERFLKEFEKDNQLRVKAARDAVKIEAFRLKNLLQASLRGKGAALGFSPYSVIGKFFAKNKSRPLQRLAIPVRYAAAGKDPMTVGIGFTGRISASWKKIAERQQEGYEYSASEGFRRALFLTGTELRKKKRAEAKYFFLRPSTTRL
jgi:hypothetical protein